MVAKLTAVLVCPVSETDISPHTYPWGTGFSGRPVGLAPAPTVASVKAIDKEPDAVHQAKLKVNDEIEASNKSTSESNGEKKASCKIDIIELDIGTSNGCFEIICQFEHKVDYVYCHFAILYLIGDSRRMGNFCSNIKQMMSTPAKLFVTFLDYNKTGLDTTDSEAELCYYDQSNEMVFGIRTSAALSATATSSTAAVTPVAATDDSVSKCSPATIDVYIKSKGKWHEESIVREKDLCRVFATFGFLCEGVIPFASFSLLLPPAARLDAASMSENTLQSPPLPTHLPPTDMTTDGNTIFTNARNTTWTHVGPAAATTATAVGAVPNSKSRGRSHLSKL
jgi:hypothetical protein